MAVDQTEAMIAAIKAQLEMIREMMPDAKKIGILYTTSEANSVSALAKYDDLAGDYGFEIVEKVLARPQIFLLRQMNFSEKLTA